MERTHTFTVTGDQASARVDVFLAEKLAPLTRSQARTLFEKGLVTVDGAPAKASHRLRAGEVVVARVPAPPEGREGGPEPEDLPLDILYEDKDIIVVNKPAGMAVHPGAGRRSGTLVGALLHHTGELSGIGAPDRPGIVHRLDKDTTGSLVVAKNDDAHRDLARQFKAHSTRRRYVALVWGDLSCDEGTIDLAIGRDASDRKKISTRARRKRRAVTRYRVLRRYPHLTLVELRPETGRTHQLRVHLASTGHPVACDPVYCKRKIPPAMDKAVADMLKSIKHQLLHAMDLGFIHPSTGEPVEFTAGMPPDMQRLIDLLEERCSNRERG